MGSLRKDDDRNLIDALKALLSLAGLTSALFYGLLWLAYYQYYSSFGITSDDVGLGKVELLSQAIVGPAALLLLFTVLSAAVIVGVTLILIGQLLFTLALNKWAGTRLLKVFVEASDHEYRTWVETLDRDLRRPVTTVIKRRRAITRILLVCSSVIGLLFMIFPLYDSAGDAAVDVHNGQTLRPLEVEVGPIDIPLLNVRSIPVTVTWKDKTKTPDIIKDNVACLMYFGRTAQEIVLFDVKNSQVVRIQSTDAIIAIKPNASLESRCSPQITTSP